ncbi:unnamed protein product [Spirodela intermedia]|uniref:Uncharacterized protein n=1 Tax=Spirodela intermedia TaxID=51605 RepID=A0A7I8IHA5_SPIIN|nr:unnamed protein product [Spirodela intermedia]CAA6657172.1 unnamed protein product [Spirodela intermedia]CAA6675735.1 unnamed protein product [Spirodela intermedia]
MKGGGSDGGPEEPEEEGGRWSGKRGGGGPTNCTTAARRTPISSTTSPSSRLQGLRLPASGDHRVFASGERPQGLPYGPGSALGQSVLSLAVDKLWGSSAGGSGAGGRRQSRSRRKKQSDGGAAGFRRRSSEEEKGSGFRAREARRPWAAPEGESAASAQDYGGWDELSSLGGWTPGKGAVSRSPSQAAAPPPPVRKGKLSRRERGGEVPCF